MAARYAVSGDQYKALDATMMDIKRQLVHEKGSPIDPVNAKRLLQLIADGKSGDIFVGEGRAVIESFRLTVPPLSLVQRISDGGYEVLRRSNDVAFTDANFRWHSLSTLDLEVGLICLNEICSSRDVAKEKLLRLGFMSLGLHHLMAFDQQYPKLIHSGGGLTVLSCDCSEFFPVIQKSGKGRTLRFFHDLAGQVGSTMRILAQRI